VIDVLQQLVVVSLCASSMASGSQRRSSLAAAATSLATAVGSIKLRYVLLVITATRLLYDKRTSYVQNIIKAIAPEFLAVPCWAVCWC
jgi:hypothetical protein